MVATDIAKEAYGPLKAKGIDLESIAISVEQSCQSIMQIVSFLGEYLHSITNCFVKG